MSDAPNDVTLLMAWREGDDSAGGVLLERYSKGVCRFFMSKVHSDDIAQDLAQRTFLACVEGRDRIRSDASFRSYVFGVAHNLFRQHLRHAVREPVDSTVTSAHDLGPSASALIGTLQRDRIVLEALRGIPLDMQVVHELRFWENLTVPEIATIVGAPEGTVKTRLRRGGIMVAAEVKRLSAANVGLDSTTTTLDRWAHGLRELIRRAGRKQAP